MKLNNPELLSLQWPQPGDFRKSIRFEFSLYVSLVILIIMLITGYVITSRYVETVTQNVADNLLLQARSYTGQASKLMLSSAEPDALLLNNICSKFVQNNPDIYWAGITGTDKRFIAHTDIKQVVIQQELSVEQNNSTQFKLQSGETFALQGDSIHITVPIRENEIDIGTIALASSDRQIKEARKIAIFTVGSITVIMILIGVPVTMIILNRKLKPISLITDSLKSVDFNNFNLNPNVQSKNEFGYLSETLKVMGARIKQASQEAIEKERMSRELEIAKEIQRNILPTRYPKNEQFEFAGIYTSAREIGGDYFDFIEFGNGQLGFLVADVSGKSLPGMLVMLLTRDIVKKHSRFILNPAELLIEVNRELLLNIKKGMFVTMFVAVIDEKNNKVSFASAGHNPLIFVNDQRGQPELIKTKGFPLGIVESGQFESRIELGHRNLCRGDWLIQYTDGINEGQNPQKEEFGMTRFVESVANLFQGSPAELVSGIIKANSDFVAGAPQYDDMTLVAMKWTGAAVIISNKEIFSFHEQS